jgi:hypothetical protein
MLPSSYDVALHEKTHPLIETSEEPWNRGLTWHHGACWLCRKKMMSTSTRYPSICRLRERDGVVEYQIGWTQWDRLDAMCWSADAEWAPVDITGRPVALPREWRMRFWLALYPWATGLGMRIGGDDLSIAFGQWVLARVHRAGQARDRAKNNR